MANEFDGFDKNVALQQGLAADARRRAEALGEARRMRRGMGTDVIGGLRGQTGGGLYTGGLSAFRDRLGRVTDVPFVDRPSTRMLSGGQPRSEVVPYTVTQPGVGDPGARYPGGRLGQEVGLPGAFAREARLRARLLADSVVGEGPLADSDRAVRGEFGGSDLIQGAGGEGGGRRPQS